MAAKRASTACRAVPRCAARGLMLRCPRCFDSIGFLPEKGAAGIECSTCESRLVCEQGIWKALLPERAARYSHFVQDYESIRAAEGRGSNSDEYYLALPYRDLSGRLSAQWAIRARTFRYIERKIMPRFTPLAHYRLRILDLGAGNGWMSYRFATAGPYTGRGGPAYQRAAMVLAQQNITSRGCHLCSPGSRRSSITCLLPIRNLTW